MVHKVRKFCVIGDNQDFETNLEADREPAWGVVVSHKYTVRCPLLLVLPYSSPSGFLMVLKDSHIA